jgi:hypothetical protein
MDGIVVKVSYRGVVRYVPRVEWERYSERQRSVYHVINDAMTPDEADAEVLRQADAVRGAAEGPWVVYRVEAKGKVPAMNAVCGQAEWAAIERVQPGVRTLVRGGIPSEGEAEQIARRAAAPPFGADGGG